jgi:hypothetical protein
MKIDYMIYSGIMYCDPCYVEDKDLLFKMDFFARFLTIYVITIKSFEYLGAQIMTELTICLS